MKFKSDIEVQAGLKDSSGSSGASGQILSSTNGNVSWVTPTVNTVARDVQNQVKAGVAINKGQAVYVTGADGTNIIVGLASNTTEATSSKTLGLLNATVAVNGFADVVQIGKLSGLNTSAATIGDPVWLGTNGNLIYGLANKPYAPAHLVFIGVVTRVNANNGEIFITVQNGFELNEIHDVDIKTEVPINGDILGYNGTLWVNKTIAEWLGFTPVSGTGTTNTLPKFTSASAIGNSQIFDNGTSVGIGTPAPSEKLEVAGSVFINGTNSALELGDIATYSSIGYNGSINYLDIKHKYTSGGIRLLVNTSTEAMRIFGSGNVFIGAGANDNGAKLNIRGPLGAVVGSGNSAIRLNNSDTGAWASISAGVVGVTNDGMQFSTDGTSRFVISSAGNLLINTTTDAGYKLDVNGTLRVSQVIRSLSTSNAGIEFGNSGSGGEFGFLKWDNASNYLYLGHSYGGVFNKNLVINSSGNVGIGTTSPTQKLEVNGVIESPYLEYKPVVFYDFNSDTTGDWTKVNVTLSVPSKSVTRYTSTGADSSISRNFNFSGGQNQIIRIRYKVVSGTVGGGEIFYSNSQHGYSGSYFKGLSLVADAQWHTLVLDMSQLTAGGTDWIDYNVTAIRFDLTNNSGVVIDIDWISVGGNGYGTQYFENDVAFMNGKVGIGTTTPSYKFDLNSNEGGISFKTYTSTTNYSEHTYSKDAGFFIDSYQSVGGAPYTKTTDLIANADAGADSQLRLFTATTGGNPAERMRIFSNGNVGINTTTDAGYKLDVNGITKSNAFLATGSGTVGVPIDTGGSKAYFNADSINGAALTLVADSIGRTIRMSSGNGTIGAIDANSSGLYIGTNTNHPITFAPNATERMAISSSGVVKVNNLAGTGARLVMADASGNLSTTASDVAPRYTKGISVSNSSYTNICTISGDGLASAIKMSFQGTSGGVVVNTTAEILVNHYQDISVTSNSGIYSQLNIRIISDNNASYSIEAQVVGAAQATAINIEIFPLNSESVTFQGTLVTAGTTLVHTTRPGIYISATGGDTGTISSGGNINSGGDVNVAGILNVGSTTNVYPVIQRGSTPSGSQGIILTAGANKTASGSGITFADNADSGGTIALVGNSGDIYGGGVNITAYGQYTAANIITFATRSGVGTTGERMRIFSGGNVFIGSSPSDNGYKLTVNGGFYGSYFKGGDSGAGSVIANFVDTFGTSAMYVRGDNRVGIGTVSPNYKLSVAPPATYGNAEDGNISISASASGGTASAPTTAGGIVFGDQNVTNGYAGRLAVVQDSPSNSSSTHMRFYTNAGGGNTATNERMRITSGGNVGIGAVSPRVKLDVEAYTAFMSLSSAINSEATTVDQQIGGIDFRKHYALAISGSIRLLQSGGVNNYSQGHLAFYTNDGSTPFGSVPPEKMRITSNGTVLIGTTTDAGHKLDVNGKIRSSGGMTIPSTQMYDLTDPNHGMIYNSGVDGPMFRGYGGFTWNTGSSGATQRMYLTPAAGLTVVGLNVTATGFFNSSDNRLKDLTDYDYNVSDIKPITYLWKDSRDNKKHIGYSAQEVQKVMPDAVNESEDGMLSVNYIEVLVAKIAELENRIKQLEK